jgi:3-deoxy-D-manno-octulosonate 8-phosphate phosphatase (KDO 8-P phosphatase)
MENIAKHFPGNFLTPFDTIAQKLGDIRAFLFDWDGVFNDGEKEINGSSTFGEIDAMGTNLLRFNNYLEHKLVPYSAIVTGERNEMSIGFARRESFHAVYYSVKNKINALRHFCKIFNLEAHQVCFFFDDVLDLSISAEAGLRIMIGGGATSLFRDYIARNALADYITLNSGGHNGLREGMELLIAASKRHDETIGERVSYSEIYKKYLQQRNTVQPDFFTADSSSNIINQP